MSKVIDFFKNKEIEKLKKQLENKESEIAQLNKKMQMLEELNSINYERAKEIYSISNRNGNKEIQGFSNAIMIDIKKSSKVICRPLLNLKDFVKQSISNCSIIDVKIQDRRNNNG